MEWNRGRGKEASLSWRKVPRWRMRGGAPARWAVAAGATTGDRWKGGTVRTAKLEPAGVVSEQSPMDTYVWMRLEQGL